MNESTSLFLTEIFDFNKKILATAQMNTIYFEKMQLDPSNQSTCMQDMEFFFIENKFGYEVNLALLKLTLSGSLSQIIPGCTIFFDFYLSSGPLLKE